MKRFLVDLSQPYLPDQGGNYATIHTFLLPANTLNVTGDSVLIKHTIYGNSNLQFVLGELIFRPIQVGGSIDVNIVHITVFRVSTIEFLILIDQIFASGGVSPTVFRLNTVNANIDFTTDINISLQATLETTINLTTVDIIQIDESTIVIE